MRDAQGTEHVNGVIRAIGGDVAAGLEMVAPELPASRPAYDPAPGVGPVAGLSFGPLAPFLRTLAPYAAQAVIAALAKRYGVDVAAFLREWGPRVEALVGPAAWAQIEPLLSLFVPGHVAPAVAPALRPMLAAPAAD